jgi:hypothetical protein
MQRDMDIIRQLLLRLDALPIRMGEAHFLTFAQPPLALEGEDPNAIAYNMRLLAKAGFIDLTPSQPAALGIGLRGLTWAGHDFLDSIRDPEIWHKTKEGAKKAGGFTVELLADLAKGLIKTQIEKHTGVIL